MIVLANIQKSFLISPLLLALIINNCLSVKLDEETKALVQLVVENNNRSLGLQMDQLVRLDVLLRDPWSYFLDLILSCPSCKDNNVQEFLHPICWKDGSNDYDQPRLLYGLQNDVLLVGRVYLREITTKSSVMIEVFFLKWKLIFSLFHRGGVTRKLCWFFLSRT